MTREQALQKLMKCEQDGDIEVAHVDADNVLRALLKTLGYGDVVAAYDKVGKWYA